MTTHATRVLTGEVVSALEAITSNVGRGDKPAGVPDGEGWLIVYVLPGGSFDGASDGPYDEAVTPYQVTSVGRTPEQCEWLADEVRDLMRSSFAPLLSGRAVVQTSLAFAGGVLRDDDVQPPVFYATDRYDIWTDST